MQKSIEQLRTAYRAYAQAHSFEKLQPQELYEPLDYILALGGKQMRPILVLMAYQLYKDSINEALPASYGIELFHNFSLLHDDIMDQAATRRGKATVHEYYNTNTAILSGDVMLVYAYQYIAQVPASILPNVLNVFNQTAIGVCEGQQMDMNFETREDVSIAEYIRMIELKTSILLDGAMQIGALIAGASLEDARLLGDFGRNMGIAFQLQDDLLDTFGDEATFGKRIGGDIVQNKKTFLFLTALQEANAAQSQELWAYYQNPVRVEDESKKIKAVQTLFVELGIQAKVYDAINSYQNRALDALKKLSIAEDRKAPLFAFLDLIMNRQS